MCNRKSEISALVEKKTGFDGSRTLIQGGFCAWCRVGSIFAQDISTKSYNVKNVTKVKSLRIALTNAYAASSSRTWSSNSELSTKQGDSTVHERETIVFERRDSNWIAVHEHLSPDPGKNAPAEK